MRLVVVIAVVSVVLGGWHSYLYLRLVRDTTVPGRLRTIGRWAILGLAVLVIATFVASSTLAPSAARWVAWPGYLWFAIAFYLALTLLVLEIPRLIISRWVRTRTPVPVGAAGSAATVTAVPDDPTPNDEQALQRRLVLSRSMALLAGSVAVGTVGYGVTQAVGRPKIARIDIPLRALPRARDGYRIAAVSDIHLGPLAGRDHAARLVEMINGLDADAVAIVGDLVDGTVGHLGAAAEPLRDLRSRRGTFFVTGNHEYFSGAGPWVEYLQQLGIRTLLNQRTEIDGIDLIGINDLEGESYHDGPDLDAALAGRDPAVPSILLAHQPVQIDQVAKRRVDLQLSGHTHGGQLWPFNAAVKLQQGHVAGLSKVDDTWLYVTRGAGFWGPPVRVGAPPDITLVRLRAM